MKKLLTFAFATQLVLLFASCTVEVAEPDKKPEGEDTPEVTVTVSLDKEELSLQVGASATLTATVAPESAPDKSVTWSSGDGSVATVADGVVTAVAEGSTTIIVTCAGGASDSCAVTVTPSPVAADGLVDLSKATVTTNAPMQYKSAGKNADECGMGGNPDWFEPLGEAAKSAREAKYGLVSNLCDNDPATSFHTNTDYGEPRTSWGCRPDVNVGMHYIEVKLPVSAKEFKLELTESQCAEEYGRVDDSGFKVYLKPAGGNFVAVGTYKYTRGNTLTISSVALSGKQSCSAIRFERVGDPDWFYCGQSFGFAEMKIWTIGPTGQPEQGGGDTPQPVDVPDHKVVPVSAPATPSGYTLVDLSKCRVTTNNPMQYKTFGYTCDGTWTGVNSAITSAQKTYRKGMYDNVANLYDNDKATSFHTNFDIYETGNSWAQREGATTPLNYIQIELPDNIHRFCIWTVNPINGAYWGYTTVGDHTHAYGEINVSKDGFGWSCTDAGECLELRGSTDGSEFYFRDIVCTSFDSIKYIKIQPHVGETSSGTFGNMAGFFGLSELRIWVK